LRIRPTRRHCESITSPWQPEVPIDSLLTDKNTAAGLQCLVPSTPHTFPSGNIPDALNDCRKRPDREQTTGDTRIIDPSSVPLSPALNPIFCALGVPADYVNVILLFGQQPKPLIFEWVLRNPRQKSDPIPETPGDCALAPWMLGSHPLNGFRSLYTARVVHCRIWPW